MTQIRDPRTHGRSEIDANEARLPLNALQAAAEIERRWGKRAQVGLVLGTGLHKLSRQIDIDTTIDYRDIPHFPCSTAIGHVGQLICGRLADVPVLVMDGRGHLYEGYHPEQVMLPIYAMRAIGIESLIVSNASGGLNPKFASGDVMVMADHVNLMFFAQRQPSQSRRFTTPWIDGAAVGGRAVRHDGFYNPGMIERAMRVSRDQDFVAHRGTYVAMSGPNYETRSEYRFLRKIGGDAVGMSTVPEVIAAANCGMKTLGLSTITNVANPDVLIGTTAEDVILAAERAEPNVRKIVIDAVAACDSRSVDSPECSPMSRKPR